MENAGCVTFLEDYVFRSKVTDASYERRAVTILHEMAHMWFGDLVTMRWWDDLWLNESFAKYVSTLATAEATRWTQRLDDVLQRREGLGLPAGPAAHDAPDRRRHPRHRGGQRQLRRHHLRQGRVGAQAARAYVGARTVLRARCAATSAGTSTATPTLQDLLDALEEASGRDLSTWSKEWLETAGVNTLRPELRAVDDDGAFTLVRGAAGGAGGPPDAALAPARASASTTAPVKGWCAASRVELDVVGASTDVPELVGEPQGRTSCSSTTTTWPTRRSGSTSSRCARFVDHIGELPRRRCRGRCAGTAAWDMTRDAEMRPGDFIDLVIAGVDQEVGVQNVQTLLLLARSAADPYGDPARAQERRRRLAIKAHDLMRSAEPGRRHPARGRALPGDQRGRRGASAAARRAARRQRVGARACGRRRAAVGVALTTGRAGPGRRRRDRQRARPRRHGSGTPARAAAACGAADGRGEGRSVGAGDRRGSAAQRGAVGHHRRLPAAGAA